jgi:hypothetical protein
VVAPPRPRRLTLSKSGGRLRRLYMPNYLLLLYADEATPAERAERQAEMPVWIELNESLREAGLLVGNGQLHDPEAATTVRVQDGETQVTDGPFAATKEVLAGYYVLACRDLDEALKQAARLPLARYGSVDVRPIRAEGATPAADG